MPVLYSANPVMFRNHPIGFIITLVLIGFYGIGLFILVIWYLNNKASKLTITERELLYEKGLLSKERSELTINSVRTTKVKQSFINRIFGVGKIEIYSAGDFPEIVVTGLPNPNKVREIIKRSQNGN